MGVQVFGNAGFATPRHPPRMKIVRSTRPDCYPPRVPPPRPRLETFLRAFGRGLGSLTYRVRTFGAEGLPEGGFLLLPNHLTWVDAIILQLACPRRIRFVIDQEIYKIRALNPIFRALGALPISARRAKDSVRAATESLGRGEIVCIFPEGELSRTGVLLRLKRGYELIARAAQVPVVPVWLDGLWGSIFSFSGGRYFFKWPRHFPYRAAVAFGKAIPTEEADVATVRERFLELGEFCYQQRPELQGHLSRAAVRGLKRRQFHVGVSDGMDGTELSRGSLLAAGIALSRHLRRACRGERIGIVLPAGKGGMVANLAVVLARKIPVNLNFSAGRAAIETALRVGEIRDTLSARLVRRKLTDFPWPEQELMLDEILPKLKKQIIAWRIAVAVLPAWLLCALLGLPRCGDREEALVLFTSGSSGEPKGVVLSHRNLLGNVGQFSVLLNLHPRDSLLACLPYFHSFGSTVCLWYPILEGIRAVTHPSPLEIVKNAELIQKHRITLLCSTPTFLRGYLRKVEKEQLESLQLIVTGAEKLPAELASAFHERFGKEIMQGYGLTETSPFASVNLPNPRASRPADVVQESNRAGSVGKLAPGMAAHIRDPEDRRQTLPAPDRDALAERAEHFRALPQRPEADGGGAAGRLV